MKRRLTPSITGLAACLAVCSGAGCGGADAPPVRSAPPPPGPASTSASASMLSAPARELPPAPLAAKEAPFPRVFRQTLASGLGVAVIEAHALPIVQLRVVVRAGMGYGPPGAGDLTGRLLKDGGTRTMVSAELLRRVETLGATLDVNVGEDATVLAMGVVKRHVDEALGLLGEVVREPRFDAGELVKLKERATDEASDRARSSGRWMASRVIFRELYAKGSPYATYDAVPSEIARITGTTVRDFHRRFYVPGNITVVVAGDVDGAAASRSAERVFGGWSGGNGARPGPGAVGVDFPRATQPAGARARRVFVVHRPRSAQSDVFVADLAPPRASADWPSIRVAAHVFGGGPTGRLFLDVREQRSLAYAADARIIELAHGDQPLVAYAGTQTAKTAEALRGILDNLERASKEPFAPAETEIARRFLTDVFAVRMETIGSIADMVVTQTTLGLPDGYWDTYRAALRKIDAPRASAVAPQMFHPDRALVVVAGDADVVAPMLARFGDVTIVDPEHEFQTLKTLPKSEGDAVKPSLPASSETPK